MCILVFAWRGVWFGLPFCLSRGFKNNVDGCRVKIF